MMKQTLGSGRQYVVAYICALLSIGAIALFLHGLVNNLVHEERRASLNLTQATLIQAHTQEIYLLLRETEVAQDPEERRLLGREIEAAANALNKAHQDLLHAQHADGGATLENDAISTLYFGAPHYLDKRIQQLLDVSRKAAKAVDTGASIQPFLKIIHKEARGALSDSLKLLLTHMKAESNDYIHSLRRTQMIATIVLLLTLLIEALFVFRPMIRTLLIQRRELFEMARTDPLTGSHNRRSFLAFADDALTRSHAHKSPLTILALDIDHFKKVTDTWGHAAGDLVIRRLAKTGLESIPETALFGRLGGEEFAALLPDIPLSQAEKIAETLRQRFKKDPPTWQGEPIACSVSIGVAIATPQDGTVLDFLARADTALYEAKHQGRDRVIVDQGGAPSPTQTKHTASGTPR